VYDECSELLGLLLEAKAAGGGSLLEPALRERAQLCTALIEEAREEAAAQAKYASLGRLAAAVLHELLNPLAFLQTNLESLEGQLPALRSGDAAAEARSLEETKGKLAESRASVERISAALSALRILLREEPPGAVQGDVRRAAEAASRLLRMRLPPGVRLEEQLADAPAVACGDGLVGQVLLHLLLRSLDALGGGGVLALRCRPAPPSWVVAEVEHGGSSSVDHHQLGFSLAQHLVERAGGHLERIQRGGPGALYVVQLPLAK
jgi:two-component system NtrC family sensor kinase